MTLFIAWINYWLYSQDLTARLPQSILAGFFAGLLMLLYLVFAEKTDEAPHLNSMLHLNAWRKMFVHSKTPRVVVFVMSNKIDDAVCYSAGSAHLNGFPVVVAGYDMPFDGIQSKFDFMEAAIKNAELHPEDVAIVIDSDAFFTGSDINPFLKRFIKKSAATPEKLDVLAVRQGRAMAPLLLGMESVWVTHNLCSNHDNSKPGIEAVYKKVRKYAAAHPEHELTLPLGLSPHRHLNSGVVVARVWAYKEFLQKASNFTRTQTLPYRNETEWDTDESIYIALVLDLIAWEVERDVFSMPLHERQGARSPYDMRAGLIGLGFANTFTGSGELEYHSASWVYNEHSKEHLLKDSPKHPHLNNSNRFREMSRFERRLHKRAYADNSGEFYTKLAVPGCVKGQKVTMFAHITLTPPLWEIRPRQKNTVNDSTRYSYPFISHAPGGSQSFTKLKQMRHGHVGAQRIMRAVRNPEAKYQGMEYLASVPLFLSTNHSIIRDSYYVKCGFHLKERSER